MSVSHPLPGNGQKAKWACPHMTYDGSCLFILCCCLCSRFHVVQAAASSLSSSPSHAGGPDHWCISVRPPKVPNQRQLSPGRLVTWQLGDLSVCSTEFRLDSGRCLLMPCCMLHGLLPLQHSTPAVLRKSFGLSSKVTGAIRACRRLPTSTFTRFCYPTA